MEDEKDNVVDLWAPQSDVPVRPHPATAALAKIGVTQESLLTNLANIATNGSRVETIRDSKGNVVQTKTIEDPAIRMKATEKLLNLITPGPKYQKRAYVEETEW